MKTTFREFLNEYKEIFNADAAIKDILKNAFGDAEYNEKEILGKIYKQTASKTLPTVVDNIATEYPELEDFKNELIAALEEEEN